MPRVLAFLLLVVSLSAVATGMESISAFSIDGHVTTRYDKTLQRLFIAVDGVLVPEKGMDEDFQLAIPSDRGTKDGSVDFVIRADMQLVEGHVLQGTGDVSMVARIELHDRRLQIIGRDGSILLSASAPNATTREKLELGAIAIASLAGASTAEEALDRAVSLERKRLSDWLQLGMAPKVGECASQSLLPALDKMGEKCNCPVCQSCGSGHAGIICACSPGDEGCRATDSVTCFGARGFACCQCGPGGAVCGCLEACYPTNPP